ncbi:MAG: pilus assembly protein PilP [Bdellovibrionales bacterium]
MERPQLIAFTLTSVLSVSLAFVVAMRFLGATRAQTPPPPPPPPAATAPGQLDEGHDPMTTEEANSGISELEGFLEPFIYDIVNRRDPFLAYAEFVAAPEGQARPTSPITRYDLEQLQLIGIMWDVRDPKAMFLDPEKEVFVLGRDESIGNRNGYIAAIREGEVVVVEAVRKRGDIIYRTRVLRIDR